jgi:tetratricopeptide (TPR) repeat protein
MTIIINPSDRESEIISVGDDLLEKFKRDPAAPKPSWAFDLQGDIREQMDHVPLFMTKLPLSRTGQAEQELSVPLQALQSLLHDVDGPAWDVAVTLKRQGNERFGVGDLKGARALYTQGIQTLSGDADGLLDGGDQAHDELLAMLYVNRALCQYRLGNYRSSLQDTQKALQLSTSPPINIKARHRQIKALLALGRLGEARSHLDQHADQGWYPEVDQEWHTLLAKQQQRHQELDSTEAALARRNVQRVPGCARSLLQSLPGFSTRPLRHDGPTDVLFLTIVLLYPEAQQFDILADVCETDALGIVLQERSVLPLPWPAVRHYALDNIRAQMMVVSANDSDEGVERWPLELTCPLGDLFGTVITQMDDHGTLFIELNGQ